MFEKVKQFLIEHVKWKKAGSYYRSDEEIIRIFEICSSNKCEQYQPKDENSGNCGICGCRLTKNKEYFSKNSWATTNCPFDPPFWTENIPTGDIPVTEQEVLQSEHEMNNPTPEQPAPPQKRGGCGCGG